MKERGLRALFCGYLLRRGSQRKAGLFVFWLGSVQQ